MRSPCTSGLSAPWLSTGLVHHRLIAHPTSGTQSLRSCHNAKMTGSLNCAPLTIMAQAMRAILLLARATAATLVGRRARSSACCSTLSSPASKDKLLTVDRVHRYRLARGRQVVAAAAGFIRLLLREPLK